MNSAYKLGQTYKTKNNEHTKQLEMDEGYFVVIQEHSEHQNLIMLAINSRRCFSKKTKQLYNSPDDHYDEFQIRAMDLLHDEICIRDNKTGTLIFGEAIMYLGENKVIEFTPFGNDLLANVQFVIQTVNGERLRGYLYASRQPKNFYL